MWQASGHIGSGVWGAQIHGVLAAETLTVRVSLGAMVHNMLRSPERVVRLRVVGDVWASDDSQGALIKPSRPQEKGLALLWRAMTEPNVSAGPLQALETTASGQVSAGALWLSWGNNEKLTLRGPGPIFDGTIQQRSNGVIAVPSSLEHFQFLALNNEITGHFGGSHSKSDMDIAVSGALPPTLMGLMAYIAYLLVNYEIASSS